MEKQFIPYEQALKLKELGFDGECLGVWHSVEVANPFLIINVTKDTQGGYFTLAPLWQQAFDWFREAHNLNGYCFIPNETGYWANSIEKKAKYEDYDEAQLACLDKLIEIVENK